eukprot:gene4371-4952_t
MTNDECMEIWGGSPAIDSFVGGIESSTTLLQSENSPNTPTTIDSSLDGDEAEEEPDKEVTDVTNVALYQDAAAKKAEKKN